MGPGCVRREWVMLHTAWQRRMMRAELCSGAVGLKRFAFLAEPLPIASQWAGLSELAERAVTTKESTDGCCLAKCVCCRQRFWALLSMFRCRAAQLVRPLRGGGWVYGFTLNQLPPLREIGRLSRNQVSENTCLLAKGARRGSAPGLTAFHSRPWFFPKVIIRKRTGLTTRSTDFQPLQQRIRSL
jgi:hypothetical protein